MKVSAILIVMIMASFLVCTLHGCAATLIPQKNVPSSVVLEQKNITLASPLKPIGKGYTFFDGIELLQSREVMTEALEKTREYETPSSELLPDAEPTPEETVNRSELFGLWSLREFAEYVESDPSHTIGYDIIHTDGKNTLISSGVLGYSPGMDQIIGDKHDLYSFAGPNDLLENGLHTDPNQWRLVLDPEENRLIIQQYDPESSSPSPDREITVDLEKRNAYYYAGFFGSPEYLVHTVVLRLYPEPLASSLGEN